MQIQTFSFIFLSFTNFKRFLLKNPLLSVPLINIDTLGVMEHEEMSHLFHLEVKFKPHS